MFYSIAYLGVTTDDIVTAYSSPEGLKEYHQNVREMGSPLDMTKMSQVGAKRYIENDLFDDNGNLIMSRPVDFLKQSLRIKLLETTKDKYFDPTKLFDPELVQYLKTIGPKSALKIYREFLISIRNNIDSSIRLLPE
jgi:hypothetical protein